MARTSGFNGLQKREKLQQLTVRVSEGLVADLEKLEARLTSEAPGEEFDRSAVVDQALRNAVRNANTELDKRASKNGGARP